MSSYHKFCKKTLPTEVCILNALLRTQLYEITINNCLLTYKEKVIEYKK